MAIRSTLTTSAKTSLQQRVDPRVLVASQVLQLAAPDLRQAVESELMENPALEMVDDDEAPLQDSQILASVAPDELRTRGLDHEGVRSQPSDGQTTDWMDFASSTDSLWDHLFAQLRSRIDPDPHGLVHYLVGSVNERGYLSVSPEETAIDCGCSLEEAEEAIEELQACEPAGIGAQNVRECLLLQLRCPETEAEELALRMIENFWDELVARNARTIMRRLKASEDEVEEAFSVIHQLQPHPADHFRTVSAASREKSVAALPDLRLSLDEQGWHVDVPGADRHTLRVTKSYETRLRDIDKGRRANRDERRHIAEYVDRAQMFLDALEQRREHMVRIGTYLIQSQTGFIQTGRYEFLRTLTRSKMAADLGLHESTVSRATNAKFVQIATGEMVSFEAFFKPALRVQKMIEEILSSENPGAPLSDEAIMKILAERGVKVARRTVNKYRDRRGLLSSRRRRTA
jgi:RNA polymerase sigma-54 factor